MKDVISVIGSANFDISANLVAPFVAADSNPGFANLGYGGVGRNIAHNLCLMGHKVKFVSIFGSDIFGGLVHDHCKSIGLDVSLSETLKEQRNGLYICINNQQGEMIAAVSATSIVEHITPEFLEKRTGEMNNSAAIVTDCNLTEESLRFIIENSIVPVFVDGVSTAKAHRVMDALQKSKMPHLHSLKLNQKEALAVTECLTVGEAAQRFINLGVENVFITLGSEGVYCRSLQDEAKFPSLPVEVVNTTGAGDAFLAGVVHAFTKGIPFPQTAQYGLMAARATLLSQQAVNPDVANILL